MQDVRALNEFVAKESAFVDDLISEVGKVIVGQTYMVERILIGLLSGGHVLLEGVPGLAKTLTVSTLCDVIEADFARVQFTPDLLPGDLIGTVIYNHQQGDFSSKLGPIFANLVLADEINRAPAKVQSALLEAMQERQVTIGDTTHPLPKPFIVMATQNPIEQEGTYRLPEAQIDRFMMMVRVGYPSREEEREIIERATAPVPATAKKQIDLEQLSTAAAATRDVYIDDRVKQYIVDVVFATREPKQRGLKELKGLIEYGASPRASIALALAGRAHAFLKHRGYVTPEDIKAIGPDVLRHRVVLTYEAEAEEVTAEDVVRRVFEVVEVPDMLPVELLRQLRTIEIRTRRLADRQLVGNYHSVFKGQGLSFREVRAYMPGDDVRFIDWNVSARMNEAYVKVFVEEREMTVMLVVDLSASEQWGTIRAPKSQLAAEVAALCAFSAIKNNDNVGLIIGTDVIEKLVPPKKGDKHVMRVIREIMGFEPEYTGTNLALALSTLVKVTKRKSVAFLISDFFADGYERALGLAAAKHDVIPVMLVDPRDEELPDVGIVAFEDFETGEEIIVDTGDHKVREHYAESMTAIRTKRDKLFRKLGLDRVVVRTDGDFVKPVRDLFAKRARRLGR